VAPVEWHAKCKRLEKAHPVLTNEGGDMIKKLHSIDDPNLRNYLCQTKPDIVELWDKVNEIIDMLNKLTPVK
jgi:hypothetical protein